MTSSATPEQTVRRSADVLLHEHIMVGQLDSSSALETANEGEVIIVNLRVRCPKAGAGRAFLHELQTHGYIVHIRHPVRAALPFWRRMRAEGLIADDPDLLIPWEDYIDALESQMKKALPP